MTPERYIEISNILDSMMESCSLSLDFLSISRDDILNSSLIFNDQYTQSLIGSVESAYYTILNSYSNESSKFNELVSELNKLVLLEYSSIDAFLSANSVQVGVFFAQKSNELGFFISEGNING